ncbi:MAG: hypothetical protein KKC51_04270 [Verrucomicrobia bacterium]|nr:hypothetical protein [Verrucomicrobiota bacterium]
MRTLAKWLIIGLPIFAVISAGIAALISRYSSPPRIEVVNDSGLLLLNVIVSGQGFEKTLPTLAPGEKIAFRATVLGESGITVEFNAGSERPRKENLGYIEASGGYWARVVITESLDVECASGIGIP